MLIYHHHYQQICASHFRLFQNRVLILRKYKADYENPYWISLLKSVLVELSSVIEQGFDLLIETI